MKKSLVAIATLTSLSAFAQSSVTLYGVADIFIGGSKISTTNAAGVVDTANPIPPSTTANPRNGQTQSVIDSGGLSGSRWGLRGTEDLGGGLRANFQLESGFNLDSGSSAQGGLLFGRQAHVGLSGGFGGVSLGRQYSLYDELRGGTDTLDHSEFSSTVAKGVWSNVGLNYAARINNSIRYTTPNFSGFTGAVEYGFGENKTATTSAGSHVSLKLVYANGPILVGFAHQQDKGNVGATAAVGTTPLIPSTGINGETFFSTAAAPKNTHNLLAATYDFGVAKLFAGINSAKDNNPGTANKETEWHIGASAPLGAVTIEADYARSKHKNVEKGNAFGVHVRYALSKRTTAYVGGVSAKDESLITGNRSGAKRSLFAAGVRHVF